MLTSMGDGVLEAARDAMQRAGDAIGKESADECPVRTGTLIRSFRSDVYVEPSGNLIMVLAYLAEHASFVHEMQDPTALGNPVHWTKPGSKPKFLEDPFNRNKDKIMPYVARRIGVYLKGGGSVE